VDFHWIPLEFCSIIILSSIVFSALRIPVEVHWTSTELLLDFHWTSTRLLLNLIWNCTLNIKSYQTLYYISSLDIIYINIYLITNSEIITLFLVGTIYRFFQYMVIITKYRKNQNHRDTISISRNVKIKLQSSLLIEKKAKYSLRASNKNFICHFLEFLINILVIVSKIEILIYNTHMNSTLSQFMSTGIH